MAPPSCPPRKVGEPPEAEERLNSKCCGCGSRVMQPVVVEVSQRLCVSQRHRGAQVTCLTSLPTPHWALSRPRPPGCSRRPRSTRGRRWVSTAAGGLFCLTGTSCSVRTFPTLCVCRPVCLAPPTLTNTPSALCLHQTSSWTCSRRRRSSRTRSATRQR